MASLKIIEALYYDPNNIKGGFNVTGVLIQMVDVDNDKLIYNGSKNDIFGEPAKRVRKKLKIILEYKGSRYTKVYDEYQPIDLPQDLNLAKDKKSFWKEIWDSLLLEPNVFGIGVKIKLLFKRLFGEPTLFKKILIVLITLLIISLRTHPDTPLFRVGLGSLRWITLDR